MTRLKGEMGLISIDDKPVVSSREVAETFGKPHKNVLRAIDNLACSSEFTRENFWRSHYKDSRNKRWPEFMITRDGFTTLIMGFSGEKAAKFKEAYMTAPIIEDPEIVKQASEMRKAGMFVSDISKALKSKTGKEITQMALLGLFTKEEKEKLSEDGNDPDELDYPSRDELENIFSERLQKERNRAGEYHGTIIRRDLMIRVLRAYILKEFTYEEVRIKYNANYSHEQFYQHFDYLKHYNYIVKVSDTKFKFCDRVKKWNRFGEV